MRQRRHLWRPEAQRGGKPVLAGALNGHNSGVVDVCFHEVRFLVCPTRFLMCLTRIRVCSTRFLVCPTRGQSVMQRHGGRVLCRARGGKPVLAGALNGHNSGVVDVCFHEVIFRVSNTDFRVPSLSSTHQGVSNALPSVSNAASTSSDC